ncbi:MAG: 3-deoxy-D-manno-octulosonic acid transferase [Pseudomonadota bacterium]
MSQSVYRALAAACAPGLRLWLDLRRRRGKEDGARMAERFGSASVARPAGPLVWVHAASIGEARSGLGLVERVRLRRPDLGILFTTGTLASAELVGRQDAARIVHQFVPLDVPAWIARFLDHWRPDAALWMESELWPNLIALTHARGIPMALVNARLSARSFARWQAIAPFLSPPVFAFDPVLAQTEADSARLAALGARRARAVGNIKYDAAPLPADPVELERLQAEVAGRPRWLAASTHPGEEEIAAAVHRALVPTHPGLLTILVPRHARRGAEVAAMLASRGLKVARRAAGERPARDRDIYLADTSGELGLLYRLSGIAFIGGSLVPHGGQNPIEAAQLGCALLFGPRMTNFRDIAATLLAAGGAVEVGDRAGLAHALSRLIADPGERRRRAAAAATVLDQGRGALERAMGELEPLLKALARAGATPEAARASA